jgi:hypothetical protein
MIETQLLLVLVGSSLLLAANLLSLRKLRLIEVARRKHTRHPK